MFDEIKDNDLFSAIIKTKAITQRYKNIGVAVSGGSDSDTMIDMFERVKETDNVHYYFMDTGIEYKATKDHLCYLEDKYEIIILRLKAYKSIPYSVHNKGVPFISKHVSEMISRLQRHNFNWANKTYDELIVKYPKCQSALKWWCNEYKNGSFFNISRNKGLKEFLIYRKPDTKISCYCCTGAKKKTAFIHEQEANYDLICNGVRRSENGIRRARYKSCFTSNLKGGPDYYRPLYFITDISKKIYDDTFNVQHSLCYTKYGLPRTGCVGCPFAIGFEEELRIINKHEQNLGKAVENIFGGSYELTREYREYRKNIIK